MSDREKLNKQLDALEPKDGAFCGAKPAPTQNTGSKKVTATAVPKK